MITFIESDVLPKNDDKLCRRLIHERDLCYLNDNGILCRATASYRGKSRQAEALSEDDDLVVIPDALVDEVLHGYHDIGHCGIARLSASVGRKYYFQDFHKRVRDFVRKCSTCARAKTHLAPRSNLGETPLATKPNEIWSLDIVCGLPVTKNKNAYTE